MSALRRRITKLVVFLRPGKAERELTREVEAHLDLLQERYRHHGLAPDEARRAARRHFGGLDRVKEAIRDERSYRLLENMRRDVGYSLRALARTPGFTVLAVLTLAVGIGATTAVVGLANAVFFRAPGGVADPSSLVGVYSDISTTPEQEFIGFSYPQYQELKARQRPFTDIATSIRSSGTMRSKTDTRPVSMVFVSGNYFELLGVQPRSGRLPRADEDSPAAAPVAVMSHTFWVEGANKIGDTVYINSTPVTLVGVLPPEFDGHRLDWYPHPDLWLPVNSYPAIFSSNRLERPDINLMIAGRLRAGVSLEAAQASISPLVGDLDLPVFPNYQIDSAIVRPFSEGRLWPRRRPALQHLMASLMGVALLMLLIGCFGITNFLVGRVMARRHELSVRLAIGASRLRIVAQLLTEAALLAVAASLLGLWIATMIARWVATFPDLFGRISLDVGPILDSRVFFVAGGLSIVTAVVVGVFPALIGLRDGAYTSAQRVPQGTSWGRVLSSPRQVFLVLQVIMTVALAVIASLFVRSLARSLAVDPGFSTDGVVIARLGTGHLDDESVGQFHRELMTRLLAQPAVRRVAISINDPFAWGMALYEVPGTDETQRTETTFVSPDYFELLRIPLLSGRTFREADGAQGTALVINHILAERLWPGEDAVGRPLRFPLLTDRAVEIVGPRDRTIVGVVRVAACRNPLDEPEPCAWGPLRSTQANALYVQSSADIGTIGQLIRETARALDDNVAISRIRTLRQHVDDVFADARMAATVAGTIAVLGCGLLLVGCIALFRVMVSERHHDIGVRLIVGATRGHVLSRVVLQALFLTAMGVLGGELLAVWIRPLIAAQLVGETATDVMPYVVPAAMILTGSVIASAVSAHQALRIDLARLFRHE